MRFQQVAFGQKFAQVSWACINISDLLAAVALEMMVMVLVDFIPVRLAWERHHVNEAIGN